MKKLVCITIDIDVDLAIRSQITNEDPALLVARLISQVYPDISTSGRGSWPASAGRHSSFFELKNYLIVSSSLVVYSATSKASTAAATAANAALAARAARVDI